MTGQETQAKGIEKLSIILHSRDFDKIHYALVLAAGSLAVNTPTTLFFTREASRALHKDGWRELPTSHGPTAGEFDDDLKAKNIGSFEELLEACVALGARVIVCDMGLRAIDMVAGDIREDVPHEIAGVVTYLNDAQADGSMLFI